MRRQRIQRRAVPSPLPALSDDLHPVLHRVYAARGVATDAAIDHGLGRLPPPAGLPGLNAATKCLADAVTSGGRILVVGDFDADGATCCALMQLALRAMGAADVQCLVPDRFRYGYGLSTGIVALGAERRPDLLVTVDNGIASLDGVAAARSHGIPVVVTDHHLPGAELPNAQAIVNPKLAGNRFPGENLAGVGVVFYLLAALRGRLRDRDWFADGTGPNLSDYLDLVALGTVADVVPLDHCNRVLVAQGLRRIRAGACRPGITELLRIAGRDPTRCVAADLGFAVGPRLNAAGRLDDMHVGVDCLVTEDQETVARMAQRLDQFNRQRQALEGRMEQEALEAIEERIARASDHLPSALCIADEGWHQGVIGILAARLKERFQRPVVAFAPAGEGQWKGSARSVPGLHMRDALAGVATRHPELVRAFGGHAAAAGLTVDESALEPFREAFQQEVAARASEDELTGVVLTDGPLEPEQITLDLARALRAAEPWGQGFPEPQFDGIFRVVERRVVGERHLRLRLRPAAGEGPVDAIAFRGVERGWDALDGEVQVVFRVNVNAWQGRERLQLVIEHME